MTFSLLLTILENLYLLLELVVVGVPGCERSAISALLGHEQAHASAYDVRCFHQRLLLGGSLFQHVVCLCFRFTEFGLIGKNDNNERDEQISDDEGDNGEAPAEQGRRVQITVADRGHSDHSQPHGVKQVAEGFSLIHTIWVHVRHLARADDHADVDDGDDQGHRDDHEGAELQLCFDRKGKRNLIFMLSVHMLSFGLVPGTIMPVQSKHLVTFHQPYDVHQGVQTVGVGSTAFTASQHIGDPGNGDSRTDYHLEE